MHEFVQYMVYYITLFRTFQYYLQILYRLFLRYIKQPGKMAPLPPYRVLRFFNYISKILKAFMFQGVIADLFPDCLN